jgi:site-specific recombinase XerD
MTVHVRNGKGGKTRVVGLGYKSAQAVERFLRKRVEYTYLANSPWLFPAWYGEALTYNGLTLMLRRRFRQAGLEFTGAHAFRRGFAISYLESGGSPGDLRVLAGIRRRCCVATRAGPSSMVSGRQSYRQVRGLEVGELPT